jgi:hypothetical protein
MHLLQMGYQYGHSGDMHEQKENNTLLKAKQI